MFHKNYSKMLVAFKVFKLITVFQIVLGFIGLGIYPNAIYQITEHSHGPVTVNINGSLILKLICGLIFGSIIILQIISYQMIKNSAQQGDAPETGSSE